MPLFEAGVRFMQKLIEIVCVKNKFVFPKLKIKFIQHEKIAFLDFLDEIFTLTEIFQFSVLGEMMMSYSGTHKKARPYSSGK